MTRGEPFDTHPADHILLAYAEGELGDAEARGIRTHIDSCVSCREQVAAFRATLAEYMEHRCAAMEAEDSAWRVNAFEARLRREPERPSPFRWRSLFQPARAFRFAPSAAALIALVLILLQLTSPPAISAREALSRAASADVRAVRSVADPVVYRKIRVNRSRNASRPEASITVETWNRRDRSRNASRGGGPVWTELETVFENNGRSGFTPLAAADFDAWRRSLESRNESVSKTALSDGSKALVVTAGPAGPVADGALLEASLVIRADDWHPVRESLRVRRTGEIDVYEIVELAYEVLPTSNLDPDVLALLGTAPPPHLLPPPAVVGPAETAAHSGALNPEETLMETLYALHRARACMGEPIEVVRSGSLVLVRGVVETGARKQELAGSLREIPGVKLEIRTAEDYLRSAPQAAGAPAGEPPVEDPAEASGSLPRVEGRWTGPELTDAANRTVTAADDSLIEAWALRRLAEAYPPHRVADLGPEARAYLQTMVREHAQGLNQKLLDMRARLDTVGASELPPAPVPADRFEWPLGVSQLFSAVEQERKLVRSLFGLIGSASFADTARMLAAAAVEAEQRSAQLERDSAVLFIRPQVGTHSDLSRR